MNPALDNLNILDVVLGLAAKAQIPIEYSGLSTADIETASQSLLDTLAAIRRALNARRGINTLPHELVIRIFSFVPQVPSEVNSIARDLGGPYEIRKVCDLHPIIEVCHLWRTLALDVSALWSSLFLRPDRYDRNVLGPSPPRDTNIFYLERCRSGPLHLYLEDIFRRDRAAGPFGGVGASSWSSIFKVEGIDVEALLRRVCELHLYVQGGWDTVSAISQAPSLSLPWSALEHLVVSCHSIHQELDRVWNGQLMLFEGQTLHLRSLPSSLVTPSPRPSLVCFFSTTWRTGGDLRAMML
ncbi:hypothetical protein C8Q80DRAFT_376594 [Daedaleopsis nitida]|nr:hypothetical protein C8Q80DRAFT_376594 [Daedaleopsis nitida]